MEDFLNSKGFYTGFITALFALRLLSFTVSAELRSEVYARAATAFGSGSGYVDLADLSVSGSDCSAALSEVNKAWTEVCVFQVGDLSTAAATYSPVYNGDTLVGANIFYRTDYIKADGYCDIERIKSDIAAVSEEFSNALTLACGEMSELEKAVVFHDYIVNRTEYAQKTVQPDGAFDYSPSEYNSVGVFLNGKAVCSGYASAYAALLRASGIEAVVVTSAEMNHDWTMLRIDGNWYHADCTWDDDESGVVYDYFLKSDEEFLQLEHYGWTVGTDSVLGGYGAAAPIADKSGAFVFDGSGESEPSPDITTGAAEFAQISVETTSAETTKSVEAADSEVFHKNDSSAGNTALLVCAAGAAVILAVSVSAVKRKNRKDRKK